MREHRITGTTDTGFPIVSRVGDGRKPYEVRTLYRMDDVEWFSRIVGQHWFTAETKRFFGSRIGSTLYGGRYFVSSEHTGFNREGRAYTIRFVEDDGSIDTPGEFLEYDTRDKAHRQARRLGLAELEKAKS